jgi:hypothetical protein
MREYSEQLWCLKKHLLNTKTHIEETLEKLSKECVETCNVGKNTRIECEEALRNILAGEEHITEILKQKEIPELVKLMGELRSIRQDLALTGLPFRANTTVTKDSIDILLKSLSETDRLLDKVDTYATEMKQELSGVKCSRCSEDLLKKIVEELI